MSKAPAEIYGLTDRAVQAGNFARLVLLDWDTEKVYETYKSKESTHRIPAKNSPVRRGDRYRQKSYRIKPEKGTREGPFFDILRGSKKLAKKICKNLLTNTLYPRYNIQADCDKPSKQRVPAFYIPQ